ncbi:hypothetical protein [Maribacter sp. 2307UL18-2]|uniref:hypothetical protein n=1 Tax=Maribacter sp. 2307UL18-2 TaxID=3386274 RepID=UPI0039BD451B
MSKKQISKDWLDAFPELRIYSANRFYKILGPTIIGLELTKLPRVEHYRPHFVIYSLCGNNAGNDLKSCMSGPILLRQFYNKKNLQFSIPYNDHSKYFQEVKAVVRDQAEICTEGNYPLGKAIQALKEYSKKPPMGVSPNSYLQAMFYEALLKITLYCDSLKEISTILDIIESRKWDAKHFKLFGTDIDSWLNNIVEISQNQSQIISIVNTNLKDLRLTKLLKSELV